MVGPLLQYILYGYYRDENFNKNYEKPSERFCRVFKKDCFTFVDIFETQLTHKQLGELICLKILTSIFESLYDIDIERLRYERKMRFNMFDFLYYFNIHKKDSLSEKEQNFVNNYFKNHIYHHDTFLTPNKIFDKMFSRITRNKIRVENNVIILH